MKDPSAAADVKICCRGAGSIKLLLGSPADTTKVLWGRKKRKHTQTHTNTHKHTHKHKHTDTDTDTDTQTQTQTQTHTHTVMSYDEPEICQLSRDEHAREASSLRPRCSH